MKYRFLFILLIFSCTVISSCKKNVVDTAGISGKWKLSSTFFGYADGGDFMWHDVTEPNAHILTFTTGGEYIRKENSNNDNRECIGTYSLSASDTLLVTTPCNLGEQKSFVSELTATTLIIDHLGIEGRIRDKYSVLP